MADVKVSGLPSITAATIGANEANIRIPVTDDDGTPTSHQLSIPELKKTVGAYGAPITLSAGTATTATPALDISQTFNEGSTKFTAVKIDITNTASDPTSLALDIQQGGSSQLSISEYGKITLKSGTFTWLTNGTVSLQFNAGSGHYLDISGGSYGGQLCLSNGSNRARLMSDGDDRLAIRAGTAGQGIHVYNTYTSASVYERGFMRWNTNVLEIGYEYVGGSWRNATIGKGFANVYWDCETSHRIQYRGNDRVIIGNNTVTIADGKDFHFGTTTGTMVAATNTQKLGFWGATPVVQQVLATGASNTVDDVITFLQTIGLCKQS